VVEALGKDIVVGGISPANFENVVSWYRDFTESTMKTTDVILYTNQ
jgi:hypothetical protein